MEKRVISEQLKRKEFSIQKKEKKERNTNS